MARELVQEHVYMVGLVGQVLVVRKFARLISGILLTVRLASVMAIAPVTRTVANASNRVEIYHMDLIVKPVVLDTLEILQMEAFAKLVTVAAKMQVAIVSPVNVCVQQKASLVIIVKSVIMLIIISATR